MQRTGNDMPSRSRVIAAISATKRIDTRAWGAAYWRRHPAPRSRRTGGCRPLRRRPAIIDGLAKLARPRHRTAARVRPCPRARRLRARCDRPHGRLRQRHRVKATVHRDDLAGRVPRRAAPTPSSRTRAPPATTRSFTRAAGAAWPGRQTALHRFLAMFGAAPQHRIEPSPERLRSWPG
jgi:hypothetical protein